MLEETGTLQERVEVSAAAKLLCRIDMCAGCTVICCMGPGNWTTGGHFILWREEERGTVHINDPASTKATRTRNTLALLQAEVIYYFICRTPAKEDDMITQEQFDAMADNWLGRLGDRVPKAGLEEALAAAKDAGITDGTFPMGLLTRQEGAAMAFRAALMGADNKGGTDNV